MIKLGLKDTLALRAAGYSKKEIEAMAAIDEENEKQNKQPAEDEKQNKQPAEDNKKAQDDAAAKESNPEPDYKSMYEELLKEKEAKEKEIEEKDNQIKEIQKDNIHEDNLPEYEKSVEEEHASLVDAFRSFY